MLPLERLAQDAVALGAGSPEAEAARQLQICNACRYCEGFCAVFPAMTRRLQFPTLDVHYLANLCHGCGACLHACAYASPHEFKLDLPPALARVRQRTWTAHAWPAAFGRAYERNGLVLSLALAAALALFLVLALAQRGTLWGATGPQGFYAVFPHGLMVALFAPVFAFALLALGIGVSRFWRAQSPGPASGAAVGEAAHHALRLTYLDGGHGEGCNEADDAWTQARRRAHHLSFYGFLLCFASTVTGTLWHYAFGWVAPYGWTSLPKLLGMAGGLMLVAGTAGLWRLHRARHPRHLAPEQRSLDQGFIALLFATGATGLVLALARGTPAVPLLLALHLGCVMAFFATMPYSKFAHGFYRSAALLKWAIERRQPSTLKLSPD